MDVSWSSFGSGLRLLFVALRSLGRISLKVISDIRAQDLGIHLYVGPDVRYNHVELNRRSGSCRVASGTGQRTAGGRPEGTGRWTATAALGVVLARLLHLVESIAEPPSLGGGSGGSREGRMGSNRCSQGSQSASAPGAVLEIVARRPSVAQIGGKRTDEFLGPRNRPRRGG